MSVFQPIPLGERIPNRTHAVSCSLPTMRSVIGYEEKDPAITSQLQGGYPRFVQHPFLRQVAQHVLKKRGLETNRRFWPTSSMRAAESLRQWLLPTDSQVLESDGISGVLLPDDDSVFARAKTFLQHTGLLMSSREAEDYLVRAGVLAAAEVEPSFEGYAAGRVKGALSRSITGVLPEEILLANSGMNAMYAAFAGADAVQRRKGRKVWIQLGWLYLDTIALLQKFTAQPESDYVFINDVFDLAALETLFNERGHEIAGVITEIPTNPLVQTPDLQSLSQLCQRNGAVLITDPSLTSIANVDVLPYSDILVSSLTKFTAPDGDVLAGLVVINGRSAFASELRPAVAAGLEPLYSRNLERLAAEIGEFESLIAQINRSTPKVAKYLESHPAVEAVYWALAPQSRENYLRIARSPEAVGSIISFSVRGDVTPVYDALRLPKGPSFGMRQTLICPFIYLAHYDMVTTDEGRAFLAAHGLHPQLLRLSVGAESADDIIAALGEALARAVF